MGCAGKRRLLTTFNVQRSRRQIIRDRYDGPQYHTETLRETATSQRKAQKIDLGHR